MMNESEHKIYKTTDYAIFKKLLGNRDVTESRVSAIKESILRIGYQPSPIIVNEKFEIIDGQGRFEACKALNLPILYVIKHGLTINDCISMNIKMKNWSERDYINCYARKGIRDYIELENMMNEFPALNWSQIYDVSKPASSKVKADLRDGKLSFQPYTYKQYERARWLSAIKPIIKESGLYTNRAIEILIRLDRYSLIDKKRMLESIERYSRAGEFASYRAQDTLVALNEIYNYNRKQRKYFADEYRKITDKKRETTNA